jgi:hypothetical protein
VYGKLGLSDCLSPPLRLTLTLTLVCVLNVCTASWGVHQATPVCTHFVDLPTCPHLLHLSRVLPPPPRVGPWCVWQAGSVRPV